MPQPAVPPAQRFLAVARRWADRNRDLDVTERQLMELALMLADSLPQPRPVEVVQRGSRRSGRRPKPPPGGPTG